MTPTVLVTGATGRQGSATAYHLLAAKVKVHALVRDLSSPAAQELERQGAKLCRGSFDDTDSLKAAAEGTTAVFLNVSPTVAEPALELRHAENVIRAAKEAGSVNTIVYSSVSMTGKHESFPNWGPYYPMRWYWTSKADIESLVRSSGFKYWTILRPAYLMSNYLQPFAGIYYPELASRHTFLTAYDPNSSMTVVDPGDVGKFAAAAILDPEAYSRHEIDLGAEAFTPDGIAQSLSKVSGKDIKTEFYSDAATLAKSNPIIPAQLWANEVGYQVDFEALKRYPVKLTTFDEYLHNNTSAVQEAFK
jgi:uncharacterized protein YbjT (DUF2867 family)